MRSWTAQAAEIVRTRGPQEGGNVLKELLVARSVAGCNGVDLDKYARFNTRMHAFYRWVGRLFRHHRPAH